MTAETAVVAPLHVLYVDFDGPLHVDSVYRTRNGIELLHHPGHTLFEHVPLLEEALAPYPDVRIVLSTSRHRNCRKASRRDALVEPSTGAKRGRNGSKACPDRTKSFSM